MILHSVSIDGFRGAFQIKAEFHNQVSYVIGRNGTGKTTLVRLLVAALSADVKYLQNAAFETIEVKFFDGKKAQKLVLLTYKRQQRSTSVDRGRTFNVTLEGTEDGLLECDSQWLESVKRFSESGLGDEDETSMLFTDHRISETINALRNLRNKGRSSQNYLSHATMIRKFLSNEIQVRWLPIERTFSINEQDEQRRVSSTHLNSVSRKVVQLQNLLVRYFAELEKQKTSELELFRNQLLIALFEVEPLQASQVISRLRVEQIEEELAQLTPELNLSGEVQDKFLHSSQMLLQSMKQRKGRPNEALRQSLARLEEILAYWKVTQVNMKDIFSKRDVFLDALADAFSLADLSEKRRMRFSKVPKILSNNEIYFEQNLSDSSRPIRVADLSSGEKQFFIMLAEVLLEKESETIFIVDEPELSLHITWQSRLVGDLRLLNPNVQLVMATHSPDMISTSEHKILQMEDLVTD